jgi:hypothetical protein
MGATEAFSAGPPTCLPFSEAENHVGSHACVGGKVLKVEAGEKGTHFLNFCADRQRCPFSVVVFASDLRHVGDVRDLEGREIQIRGDIREYDGHAEIILERPSQLIGDAARIPPLPKDYDVTRRGHYSAGQFSRAKKPKTSYPRKAKPPSDITWDTEQNADPD